MSVNTPVHLDLKKDKGLTVQWADGTGSYYSIAYLRRMSPSADMRELRRAMAHNPLTVLPNLTGGGSTGGSLVAESAEMVGNYAIRIAFSDGHSSGIYSWDYLREIDPRNAELGDDPTRITASKDDASHANPLGLGPGSPPRGR